MLRDEPESGKVWSNQVGMFELSENGLHYYELRVQRGLRQMQVVADQEELEESFHLNVLDSDAGIQMADRILSSCAERLLQKRLFSAIILTAGDLHRRTGRQILAADRKRRRVFAEWMYLPEGR